MSAEIALREQLRALQESEHPRRTDVMQPDIPTFVRDVDSAWDMAKRDKSIWSRRSRAQDPVRWQAYEEDKQSMQLTASTTDSGRRRDYHGASSRMHTEAELQNRHGIVLNFDEEKTDAEIARRLHWVGVFYEHPQVAQLGMSVDSLLREEEVVADTRNQAAELQGLHAKGLQAQAERTFHVQEFLDGIDYKAGINFKDRAVERQRELYKDTSTTVGDLNNVVFEELDRAATDLVVQADSKQQFLDNLAEGILPEEEASA